MKNRDLNQSQLFVWRDIIYLESKYKYIDKIKNLEHKRLIYQKFIENKIRLQKYFVDFGVSSCTNSEYVILLSPFLLNLFIK